jgi:CBS domain-containing membrane protein
MTSTSLPDDKPASSSERAVAFRAASRRWLRSFWPAPVMVNNKERLRALCGAAFGISLTGLLCHLLGSANLPGSPWLYAPLGASAVLVFAVPSSPMAQPWPVIGGNTLSALVGIVCARWISPPELATGMAVGLAIGVMFATRSLHPPGGATALFTSLGMVTHFEFALFPVLLNSLLLVMAGVAYNNLTRHRYPHAPPRPIPKPAPGSKPEYVVASDLDAVLARYNEVLDINRDDLQALLEQTQARTYERKMSEVRCRDIMTRDVVTVEFGTPLAEAWALMRKHKIKALPVVDRTHRIVGIVTQSDFMREADLDTHDGFDGKLRLFLRATGVTHTTKPEVVGQIMTRKVRVASEGRRLVELVPLFGSSGHHHIPIIGEKERLVGILTQSDFVAALHHPEEDLVA